MWIYILILLGTVIPQYVAFPVGISPSPSSSSIGGSIDNTRMSSYSKEVIDWLDGQNISWTYGNIPDCYCHPSSTILELTEPSNLLLHLIPTPSRQIDALPPNHNQRLTDWVSSHQHDNQDNHGTNYTKVIHLHQDVWTTKNPIVKSRLFVQSSAAGGAQHYHRRIFARKTAVSKINATYAMSFLEHHHLWGSTRAKYYYGLFYKEVKKKKTNSSNTTTTTASSLSSSPVEELVAVATFSTRRRVQRSGRTFQSHELLRFCTQRDMTVVGGISKLCQQFIRDVHPDDIVTVIDRDWGDGSGWHSLGFETVATMDPLVMMLNPNEIGLRRHLVGAGIRYDNDKEDTTTTTTGTLLTQRLGLPKNVLAKLDSIHDPHDALNILSQHNFFPVYDTGVERLLKVVNHEPKKDGCLLTASQLWKESQPKYASSYYSNCSGISSLLDYAATNSNT